MVAAPQTTDTASVAAPRSRDLLAELHGGSGGLTADQVARDALSTAPSVRRAQAAADQSRAGAQSTLVAFFPTVDLSARYTRLSRITPPQISFGTSLTPAQIAAAQSLVDGVMDPSARALFQANLDAQVAASSGSGFSFPVILNNYAFKASLSWPVSDLFLTILPSYNAQQELVEAAEAQELAQRQTIALQAREAFYNYARAKAALLVADMLVEQVEAHRQNVQAFVNAGTAAQVDLMRIDAQLAAARVSKARAEGGVATSAAALRTLLHTDNQAELSIGEDLLADMPAPQVTRDALYERAMANRSDVAALRHLVEARGSLVAARRNAAIPHLSVSGNVDIANPNSRFVPQQQEFRTTWDVSAVLSWSPNSIGTAIANGNAASADRAVAQADLDSLEDAVRIEVTQAYEGYEASRQALAAARVGVTAAEESYRVRVEQFRIGSVVTSDMLDADAELNRSRLDLVNAAADLRIADARLRRALGDNVRD